MNFRFYLNVRDWIDSSRRRHRSGLVTPKLLVIVVSGCMAWGAPHPGFSLGAEIGDPRAAVIIGDGDPADDPEMDIVRCSRTLLEVQREDKGTHGEWAVHISTDGGRSWNETYTQPCVTGHDVVDLSCAVIEHFFYVAYTTDSNPGQARVRRFSTSDGTVDSTYGSQIVLDSPHDVKELVLVSSETGGLEGRLWLTAIDDYGTVHLFSTDWEGGSGSLPWQGTATFINNASFGLDATYAERNTGIELYIVYVAFSGNVWVSRWGTGDEVLIGVLDTFDNTGPRISAYGESVMVVFEDDHDGWDGTHVEYRLSDDGFDTWYPAGIVAEADTDVMVGATDVTLRKGRGGVIVWGRDAWLDDGVFERGLFAGSNTAWTTIHEAGSTDPEVVTSMRIEPMFDGGWGILRAVGDSSQVEFELSPLLLFDGFELGNTDQWWVE